MTKTPTNRTLTCVVCGGPIIESQNEIPCVIPSADRGDYGDYEGQAYHLNKCEDGIFDEIICQI